MVTPAAGTPNDTRLRRGPELWPEGDEVAPPGSPKGVSRREVEKSLKLTTALPIAYHGPPVHPV